MQRPDPAPAPVRPPGNSGKAYEIKVYLVLQRDRVTREGEPNVRVIAAKLNKKAADDVVAKIPGTHVHKVFASKT